MNSLLQFDALMTQFLTGLIPHTSFFDFIFSFLSLKGYSIAIWLVIVIALLIFEEKRDKKHHFIGYFLLSFVATAVIVSYPLKMVFHRERPITTASFSQQSCPKDFSFPSGHAATAFAAATFLAVHDKKRRWFYYLVAVLISFSRIYLQCHFFFDVIVGGVIGTGISGIVIYLETRLNQFQKR